MFMIVEYRDLRCDKTVTPPPTEDVHVLIPRTCAHANQQIDYPGLFR